MFKPLVLVFTLTLIVQATGHAADAADTFKKERAEFVRAYANAEQGLPTGDASDALRDYPLYPYLQAAKLRRSLAESKPTTPMDAMDEAVEAFLRTYGTDAATRDLRRAWLSSLAQRKAWTKFLAHYVDSGADDTLRCSNFSARIDTQRTEGLESDVAKQWLTPQSVRECEQAFDWLRARDQLTPALIEQRAKLALDRNNRAFARQIIAMLPPERASELSKWVALVEQPRTIDQYIASPDRKIEGPALLAGWSRLARTDRDGAIARYESLVRARGFSPREASPYALALALPLSWDRRGEALRYFALVDAADMDDVAREWHTRSALWAKDWPLATRTIATMSTEQRNLSRWRYWSARTAEKANQPELARQLFQSVVRDDNYYSAMSAARLGEQVVPRLEQVALDRTQLTELERLPGLVRARELLWSELRSQAQIEWLRAYETLSEKARSQAIHLAARWGWYDQAVATATQQRVFNDYSLLYPRPYDREVAGAAKLASLEPEIIYSVMRQESLYRADAISSAGARGLLQMLPSTARATAQRWKQPRPSPEDLLRPQINVPLGAAHLRELVDRFNGQIPVALAGYNAGPNAAARWLPAESIESDVWIENIPYNETRTYVQRILWHSVVFGWLRSGEAQATDAWVTRIAPLSGSAMVGAN